MPLSFSRILGPSPLFYGVKKIKTYLFFHGGSDSEKSSCLPGEEFFEIFPESIDSGTAQPPRLTHQELLKLVSSSKAKLTKEQKLLQSVLKEVNLSRALSDGSFQTVEEMYKFRRKYKIYLRIKRFIPLSLVGPFTGSELSKMAYAAAIGSKSVSLTMSGVIGYSLPAFFFFHMSSYYLPDKLKPACQVCKYTLGAPFIIISSLTDGVMSSPEEFVFGEEVPIDTVNTGGTIPGDLGDFDKLREILSEMKGLKGWSEDLAKKTY